MTVVGIGAELFWGDGASVRVDDGAVGIGARVRVPVPTMASSASGPSRAAIPTDAEQLAAGACGRRWMPQLISVFLSVVKCGVDFLAAFADLDSGTALRPVSSFFIGSPSDGSADAAVCGLRMDGPSSARR